MRALVLIFPLILVGCTASGIAFVDSFDKGVLEPRTDANYDEAFKRWCRLPIDIQLRAIRRGTISPRTLTDNCSEWRDIKYAYEC